MPRKTKAQREAELDARSLVGKEAIAEARKRWDALSAADPECYWPSDRFDSGNVRFELRREEKTTAFTLTVSLGIARRIRDPALSTPLFYPPSSCFLFPPVVELSGLTAFPSTETLRAEIEATSDLIRSEKIVAAYERLLRCFLPVPIEEMHTETGYDA